MTKSVLTGSESHLICHHCPKECSGFRISVCPTCVFCFSILFTCPCFVLYKTGLCAFLLLFSGEHWFCLLPHLGCSRYRMPCTQQKVVEGLSRQNSTFNSKDFIFLFNLRHDELLRYYWWQQNPYTCIFSRQQNFEEIKPHILRSTVFLCVF